MRLLGTCVCVEVRTVSQKTFAAQCNLFSPDHDRASSISISPHGTISTGITVCCHPGTVLPPSEPLVRTTEVTALMRDTTACISFVAIVCQHQEFVWRTGAKSGPAWDDSPAGIPPRNRSQDGPGLRQHPDAPSYRPGSAEPYSNTRYQHNRLTPSRTNAPHAWVGTYWDRELSPYVRESFEHAQGALMAQQALQSSSNWLRDQLGQGQSRGGWIDDERFQMPSGSQFPSRAQLAPQQRQQQGLRHL